MTAVSGTENVGGTPLRRARWAPLAVAGLALGLAIAAPGTAWADPPSRLDDQVTDSAEALVGSQDEVDAALEQLQSETAIQLWVAYVDSFDGLSGQEWTDQTALQSGMGGNDLLFAVATEDRAHGWSAGDSVAVTDEQIEDVIATRAEPLLGDEQWAAAAIALADGLADEASGSGGADAGSGSGGGSESDADSSSDSAGGVALWPFLLVGALAIVGAIGFRAWRRSRPGGAGGAGGRSGDGTGAPDGFEVGPQPIERLRAEAAARLVDADDSIKTSEQELGFAVAQFGDEAAAPFTAALAQSKEDVSRAFALHRQTQVQPDAPGERELLDQVVALCTAADQRLDDQVAAFDELRDLERTIDTVLPGLARQVQSLHDRSEIATGTLTQLRARWAPAAMANLGRNLEQADERLAFAETSVGKGSTLLAEGDRGAAVAHARAAEDAIGQANELYDLIGAAPGIIQVAQDAIAALMTETDKDLAEAARLGIPAELAATHTFATETLAWARTAVGSGNYDPITVRRALEESDNALEQGLAPLRAAAESRSRAEALLPTATQAAEASIRASDDFITTRRGAVGAEARSRLAEARRQLGIAQVPGTDPVAALQGVQAADQLADQAMALAQQDEARFQDAQRQQGSPGMGGLGSVILGGILIDAMSRGGGFRGGFGGGFGGSGGSRSGGGVRLPGPGSFGGSATRGRRGGGGRF